MKRALVVAGCAALTVTVSACESTEQESAKIGREGVAAANAGSLKLGGVNRHVHVSSVTLISGGGRMAVAAKLTSSSAGTQENVPVLVNAVGADGKVLYSNAAGGAEASLQHIGLLRSHQSAWWVDDQVLTSQHTSAVRVRVGTGSSGHGSPLASFVTSAVHTHTSAGVSNLSGTIVSRSKGSEEKVAVYAVALKGTRVVAAGRTVVPSAGGHAGAATPFQMFLVGNAAGARVQTTVAPAG